MKSISTVPHVKLVNAVISTNFVKISFIVLLQFYQYVIFEMLDVEMEYDESTEERKVHYTFTTPWVPPIPFFKALVAKWPELTFSIIWEQYGYDGDDHGAEYDGSNGILEEINSW